MLSAIPETTGIRARVNTTAYAKFAEQYDELPAKHCGPNTIRQRRVNPTLEILERTCECGNDRMLVPDGTLGDTCRECQEIEEQRRQARRAGNTAHDRPAVQANCRTAP